MKFYCSILLFLVSINLCCSSLIYHLGGNDWIVFDTNKRSASIPSKVPGSIYSDLRRAGVLDELYRDFDDVKSRWVAYANWTFAKNFDLNDDVLNHQQIYLTCHGLDTISNVTLNGHYIGSSDNMFVRYRWPVKNLLKPRQNVIQISFVSAPFYARQYFLDKNIPIPPICPPKVQNGECHVNFIRKMQASFSWDWGPAFPTQGIWQPIVLEAYDNVIIRSVSVNTIFEHSGQWLLNATVWMESQPANSINANLTLHLDGQLLLTKEFSTRFDAEGESYVNVFVMVPIEFKIEPWYPNGLGDQMLYRLNVTVQTRHESVHKNVAIGFRTIELVQDKLNSTMEAYSFYFKVNGIPIYSKGSNWIPAHVLAENVSKEYLAFLLWSAKEANMNMLRVWGGGIYETDFFYELADQYGILIWQDMMFACALYPTDPKFLSSVSKEIRQQIRRLHHHPSIAIWAGNNENEVAIAQMWWPELILHLSNYKNDYLKLYIDTIMPIVLREDVSRPFVSSSPSNGIVSPRENYISTEPQSPRYGDVHHYISYGDAWDWKLAPSAKFVSEYGFQSLPSLSLLQKYLSKEYLKYPFNEGLTHREHQMNGINYLTDFMSQHLPLPINSTGSVSQLADFIYMSQIFQAMAIKIQTEFYRRNRQLNQTTGEGFTMGALYWQLNNIWPGFSWTSVEYEGKWKMLHYFVKKIFDNLLVDVYEDQDVLKVVIIRDDYSHYANFTVNIHVYDWLQQNPLYTHLTNSMTGSFGVTLAYQEYTNNLLRRANCLDRNRCFIKVEIMGVLNGHKQTRDNFLFLGKLKDIKPSLIIPKIELKSFNGPKLHTGSYIYEIELTTDKIAPFVWLDFLPMSNIFSVFSDNGFLMIKDARIQIRTTKNLSKQEIINALTIKTFNDIKNA